MNRKLSTVFIVAVIILFGAVLRFYNLTENPNSLNNDEVAYGYNAYSILKTARDEYGVFMPLSFQSVGDYKNPVLIYLLVPSIAVFGLNEFGIRFVSAFFGVISIPVFFLFLRILSKNDKITLIGTALLAISPWHIYYSRFTSDHLVALFLLILGMYFFQKMLEGKKIWAFLSAFILILSMYTYHTNRLFIPLFILAVLIINYKKLSIDKYKTIIFMLTCAILLIPIIYLSFTSKANTRAAMVFLTQDIEYTRYVILDHIQRKGEYFLLFFFWIRKYLNYFQPDFLFFTGLNMTKTGTLGLGVLYLFELPWLILGIIGLVNSQIRNKATIISWLLIGLIPASITNNEQSAGRSLIILPVILIIISFGVLNFFRYLNLIKNKLLKISAISVYALFVLVVLIQAVLVFSVHFPRQRDEAFMKGTKEAVLYALENKDKYNEIVFDPYRGVEAPYIVNIPHMYILFYSAYDPGKYQKEAKKINDELFVFNKFTIRRINWRIEADRKKKGILFIGSPWSLPLKDLREDEILKRIYLSNNKDLALLIVTPKGDYTYLLQK